MKIQLMTAVAALGIQLLFSSGVRVIAEDEFAVSTELVSANGSERATSGSGGKIVTFDGVTHIVWQDATDSGAYLNRVRSMNHTTGEWSEPFTLNKGKDNHARPVIAVDREGYLHVILSGHSSPVKLPARPEQMDILGRHIGPGRNDLPPPVVLAQGSLVVDPRGTPHVLYITHQKQPGQVVIASPNSSGVWQHKTVTEVADAYPESRPVGCRGSFTMTADGTRYALLELKPLGEGWADGKPTRPLAFMQKNKRLVWLQSRADGQGFSVQAALPEGALFHQANVERPAGYNQISSGHVPPFAYFDGASRYRKGNEVLQNNVHFVARQK
jgi:hypothetical protein